MSLISTTGASPPESSKIPAPTLLRETYSLSRQSLDRSRFFNVIVPEITTAFFNNRITHFSGVITFLGDNLSGNDAEKIVAQVFFLDRIFRPNVTLTPAMLNGADKKMVAMMAMLFSIDPRMGCRGMFTELPNDIRAQTQDEWNNAFAGLLAEFGDLNKVTFETIPPPYSISVSQGYIQEGGHSAPISTTREPSALRLITPPDDEQPDLPPIPSSGRRFQESGGHSARASIAPQPSTSRLQPAPPTTPPDATNFRQLSQAITALRDEQRAAEAAAKEREMAAEHRHEELLHALPDAIRAALIPILEKLSAFIDGEVKRREEIEASLAKISQAGAGIGELRDLLVPMAEAQSASTKSLQPVLIQIADALTKMAGGSATVQQDSGNTVPGDPGDPVRRIQPTMPAT